MGTRIELVTGCTKFARVSYHSRADRRNQPRDAQRFARNQARQASQKHSTSRGPVNRNTAQIADKL